MKTRSWPIGGAGTDMGMGAAAAPAAEDAPPCCWGADDVGLLQRERAARTSSSTSVCVPVNSNALDTSAAETVPVYQATAITASSYYYWEKRALWIKDGDWDDITRDPHMDRAIFFLTFSAFCHGAAHQQLAVRQHQRRVVQRGHQDGDREGPELPYFVSRLQLHSSVDVIR